jgi:hypothetical protein
VLEELFEAIADGDYFAVTAYVQPTPSTQLAFDAIRTAVREARHVATTLGYGPRFLHSTGQLHKGGPPRGSFLQVTASDQHDITMPDKPSRSASSSARRASVTSNHSSATAAPWRASTSAPI